MELVCMDYLTLETSKGGYDNILVLTDHFTRYAQAIPTHNHTAHTTAKALFESFIVHALWFSCTAAQRPRAQLRAKGHPRTMQNYGYKEVADHAVPANGQRNVQEI